MGQDIPRFRDTGTCIVDSNGKFVDEAPSGAYLRAMMDGAEDEHQRTWTGSHKGYPNMRIEAVFDSPVKEKSPHRDMTGYSRVLFGEGSSQVEANVTSGMLVLRAPPVSRLIVEPMNSGSVRVIAQPL